MLGWLIFAIYLLGYVAAWRRIVWLIAHDISNEPEAFDWFEAVFIACILSLFWPIAAPFYFLYDRGILQKQVAKPPRAAALRQKERELKEREQRVAQLERETGIGQQIEQRSA